MIYGYARVSTDGQSVDAQVRQLTKAGCRKVFREVASGAKTDRAQLRRLLGQLEAGDVLTVTRLDRLARSTRDLLNTLATITGKKAGFRSLGDTWADTTTSHGRLMLTVLGGLAEFERDLIRVRTGEGRERAKARGVKMGRKPKLTPHQQREALKRRDRGEPVREIARSFNVHHATISRLASGIMQLSRLGTTRNTYLLVAALLFGAMPTRVFLAISSDIILVAAILLPFVMAFMIILSTEDISFGLPTTNDMDAKLEERREKVRVQLIDTLSQNLRLIIGVIAGKAICVWLIDCGTLAAILTHLIALLVGVLIVFCIDSFTRLIPVFNYLNIAAEMGAAVKKHLLRDRRL